jgi:hypothetical protein
MWTGGVCHKRPGYAAQAMFLSDTSLKWFKGLPPCGPVNKRDPSGRKPAAPAPSRLIVERIGLESHR